MAQEGGSKDLGKSSTGMEVKVAALLSYVIGFVTGIIFFLIEKESKFVKFHAMQSICVSVAFVAASIILPIIPVIGVLALMLLNLGGLILWILCMVKAYQGEVFRLPVVGDIAAKQAGI